MSRRWTGPEDPPPGQVVSLTPDQLTELQDLLSRQHRGTVRLHDRGAAWVEAELTDSEGRVLRNWLLPPVSAWEGHQSKLRRARERRAIEGREQTSCVNPPGEKGGSAGGRAKPGCGPGAHPPGPPGDPPLADGALRKRHESRPARRLGRRKTARAGRPSAAVRLRRSTSTAEMLSALLVGASERQVRRGLLCGCHLLLSGGGSVGGEEAGGHRLSRRAGPRRVPTRSGS